MNQIKEMLKNIKQKLIGQRAVTFFKKWNEFVILIPIGTALLLISPVWLYQLSGGTAATYDLGVTQKFIYAILTVSVASGLASVVMKLNFPEVFNYLFHGFGAEYQNLSVVNKLLIAFSIYGFLFTMMVISILIF